MNRKALYIGVCVLVVVLIAAALLLFLPSGRTYQRAMKVLDMAGTCTVERGGKTVAAAKDMKLLSGDIIAVGKDSSARLLLDDDKYIYLDAGTRIHITAEGSAADSKTQVFVEQGSMLTEVKRKLSTASTYDVVTPNTTMSIRGTKTLTEVYEDVLGAIKTNAAVVEGQVSFKTVQKDSTGKAVAVTTALNVGQGFGVATDSKDLLSLEDVRHITDAGKTVDGQVAEETTHEKLGTTLETPVFSEDFLTNIVAVLARSREEDIEEGFAAESVTEEELNAAINVLNDVIDGKIELPAAVEEYIISQTQPYYDEPVGFEEPEINGGEDNEPDQPTPREDIAPVADDTVVPGEPGGNGDDTFVVDDTGETLVNIEDIADDDDNEGAAIGDDDNGGAAIGDEDDDEPEDKETEEERLAREEAERLAKEEAERLAKEEEERIAKEEAERLAKEEAERLAKEEEERKQQEAAAAHTHSYGAPEYTWAADHSTCTASRECSCGDKQTAEASVTSRAADPGSSEAGKITYTAVFSADWAETQTSTVDILTETIKDVVTEHVQISEEKLNGQVKVKAVKVKTDGTVVSVARDLEEGDEVPSEGSGEEPTVQGEPAAQGETGDAADTGSDAPELGVEIVPAEEADTVFNMGLFDETYIENIRGILAADAGIEDVGAELNENQVGQLEAIDTALEPVWDEFDKIREESQQKIDAAMNGQNPADDQGGEAVSEPVPSGGEQPVSDPVASDVSEPVSVVDSGN